MTTENDHIWFDEQLAAYLAGGLTGEDLARFEAHAQACPDCAAKLQIARDNDSELRDLFRPVSPSFTFEDQIIQTLRKSRSRTLRFPTLHPAVRKAAVATAAVIVLGGFGYVGTIAMDHGRIPVLWTDARMAQHKPASQLSQLGPASQLSSDEDLNDGGFGGTEHDVLRKSRQDSEKLSKAPAAATPPQISPGDIVYNNVTAGRGFHGQFGSSAGSAVVSGDRHLALDQNAVGSANSDSIYTRRAPQVDYYKPAPVDLKKQLETQVQGQAGGQQAQKPTEVTELKSRAQADTNGTLNAPNASAYYFDAQKAPEVAETPALTPATPPPAAPPATQPGERKIIRNGTMEFEIDSFDNAALTIAKIAREEGGFVGSTNSEKLPNGKVKGDITLRVPPDHLDTLVLKLRALGDLKRQNLTSDDVTKQYNDLQSELRAAQAMQERLLDLIKNGKGQVKDLLAAEKELGTWREKIEKVQGEINYYNNLVSMATLTITLYERDIRQAAEVKQTETVDMGVETEDVEQSRTSALKAIDDAKGRIIQSELKKFEAGELAAKIVADVAPDQAGAVIDRLKQLGKVARLEIQRAQTAPDDGKVKTTGFKVERGDTRLNISMYNLANVAPRQTVNLNLASDDVEKTYHAIVSRVEKANGRVVSSSLNRGKPDQTTGAIQFETKSTDADAVLQDVRALGEAMKLTVTENPDTANVTTAKRGFAVQIASTATAAAREAETMTLASPDVPTSFRALLNTAQTLGLRVAESQLNQTDPQNVSGMMTIELKRDQQAEFEKALDAQGQLINRNVTRSTDTENTLDTKLRWQIALIDAQRIAPRQSTSMTVETSDVEQSLAQATATTEGAGGRVSDSGVQKDPSGASMAKARIDVPLDKAAGLIDALRQQGKVRQIQSSTNMQAPDGKLARAQIELTFTSGDQIVSADNGLWATIRNGLATSVSGLLWSLQLIIIGLCLVAPWALLIWAGWKLIRRKKQTAPATV